MIKIISKVALCALIALPWVAYADMYFKPGNWQITTKVEISGMPLKMPAQTQTRCLSAEQAKKSFEQTLKSTQIKGCTVSGYSFKDNQAHWKMACSEEKTASTMQGEGWIHIMDENHYTSKINLNAKVQDKTMLTTTHTNAKWLGECRQ